MTGHTGFKGAWLTLWLTELGADLTGVALEPVSADGAYEQLGPWPTVDDRRIDIRDADALADAVLAANPEVVFHLAAQSLVRVGHSQPLATFGTNVLGTANLLAALDQVPDVRATVIATSDKVYENAETGEPFVESSPLGGNDPYSASKACVELVVTGWPRRQGLVIATARAGNVIGGGDCGEDRLIPDIVAAVKRGVPVKIRYPSSVRPWQHVLEPIGGYLVLAERAWSGADAVKPSPWTYNFGPPPASMITVGELVEMVLAEFGEGAWVGDSAPQPPEAATLRLDSTAAQRDLGWHARLGLEDAVRWTVEWYRSDRTARRELACRQLRDFLGGRQ